MVVESWGPEAGVEFRLLGPVEVWAGGRLVPAGEPRRRAVLAVLAASTGAVVSQDTLVDRVWGDAAPPGAHDTLRCHVTRLRRVLESAAGSARTSSRTDGAAAGAVARIERRAGGYQLDVDPDRVDLHRFRRLVAAAREPGLAGSDRVELLRRAVDLWRGEPLAGIGGAWAARTADTWRRERWQAIVTWAHAELTIGNPEVVLTPLTELAGEHPEVEPLTEALMRALVAVGRPTDALAVGDQHRRHLAAEYGTDQAPELAALYQAILRGETRRPPGSAGAKPPGAAAPPTGSEPPPTTLAPVALVPAQLPADVPAFTGRARHLAELDRLLDPTGKPPTAVIIAALSGTAGVGKTALAIHWAHTNAHHFPDGQLYLDLRGYHPTGQTTTTTEATRTLLDALGVPPNRIPPDPDAQTALYRTLLTGKRLLVLLDNARDTTQVQPLLPGTPTCLALVTSRDRLTGLTTHGAHPITLDLLTPTEAEHLLTRHLGHHRLTAEPEATDTIIDACARLPLALAIVAARARHTGFPLTTIAAELTDNTHRLDALDGGDPTTQIRTVFSWSYQALTPQAATLFRHLGLHPGPHITTPTTASLTAQTTPQTRVQLTELTRANLLTEHAPGRYTLHDLLRAYATDLTNETDRPAQRHTATTRLLDHYLHTAHAADRLLNPTRDPMPLPLHPPTRGANSEPVTNEKAATIWFGREHPALLAALRHCAEAGFDGHAWRLAWAMDTFLDRRGHWHDLADAWRLALSAAERLDDPTATACAHRLLAWAAIRLEDHDAADRHLNQALELYSGAGDLVGRGYVHSKLARLRENQGAPERGLNHAELALALFQTAGDQRGVALALNAVGWYHTLLGDHAQALTHCERALTLRVRLGDRLGAAATWDSLGLAHHNLGDHGQAVDCYRHAIDMIRDLGDRYDEADCLTRLGETHQAANDRTAAAAAWRLALDILTELDHPDARAVRDRLRRLGDRGRHG